MAAVLEQALPEDEDEEVTGEGLGWAHAGAGFAHLRSLKLHHVAAAWGAGAVLHAAHLGTSLDVLAAGGGTAACTGGALGFTWHHLSTWARVHAGTAAAFATAWASWAAAHGPGGPVNASMLAAGTALILPWWLKRAPGFLPEEKPPAPEPVRAPPPPPGEPEPDTTPERVRELLEIYDRYVASPKGPLPGTSLTDPAEGENGVSADIVLRRGEQNASAALAQWKMVASAYQLSCTRVLMELDKAGVESRARLTVLDREVLSDRNVWPGSTLDMATGLARGGMFFDGMPLHFRFTAADDGAKHWLIAGTTGSGKTTGVFWTIAETTDPGNPVPIMNILIDPEEGAQSLPLWQDKLAFSFTGEEDGIRALRGLDELQRQRAREMSAEGRDCFTATWDRPQVNVIIEESSALMKESAYKAEAVDLIARLGKRGRKRGISVILVALVPSLEELDSQTLRSMLRSGNIWCFRTGDSVSGGMLGLHVDPSQLPEFFADGTPTYGLSYVKGPDGRQATARSWDIPKDQKAGIVARAVECPLDASSREAFERGFTARDTPVLSPAAAAARDEERDQARPAAAPVLGDLAKAQRIRDTAAHIILAFLAASPGEHYKGDICVGIRPSGITSVSTTGNALHSLVTAGLVHTDGEKFPYRITGAGLAWLAENPLAA
jgi:hypothetical protein